MKLTQKEDTINENERGNSFARGLFFYMDQSYLVYNCKTGSFRYADTRISAWKSAGMFNYFDNSNMNAVGNTSGNKPNLKNDGRMHGRNVLIFGVYEDSVIHANNKANNIFVMGDGFTQGINDTTLYAEKIYSQNFTQPSTKFVLSLHYNGDDSYLFVNGKQELKFKCKTDQLVKQKLCIGNLSDKWSTSESEKTGLYGNIYDFVVDYEQIAGVKAIYDMHRYLMMKHNISP